MKGLCSSKGSMSDIFIIMTPVWKSQWGQQADNIRPNKVSQVMYFKVEMLRYLNYKAPTQTPKTQSTGTHGPARFHTTPLTHCSLASNLWLCHLTKFWYVPSLDVILSESFLPSSGVLLKLIWPFSTQQYTFSIFLQPIRLQDGGSSTRSWHFPDVLSLREGLSPGSD